MCSVVRRSYLQLSLLTDDVWSNEKSDYERAKRERKKMRRVEQQERERGKEEICSTLRKRESENEEIAERVSTLNSGICRKRKRG